MDSRDSQLNSWRDYQKNLRKITRRKHYLKRTPWLGLYGCAIFVLLAIVAYAGSWLFAHLGETVPREETKEESAGPQRLSKADLPHILEGLDPDGRGGGGDLIVVREGAEFRVETSFDGALQNYVTDFLRRTMTHQAAAVVMRPDNGQVLAMSTYDPHNAAEKENLCLKSQFPAASLFKIVAAAAAIEARGFTPDRTLAYRGGRYTLYKSQLKQAQGRNTNTISFKNAFSRSVNPVFGRIGIYDLGRDLLRDYAGRFLFNLPIPFDLPLPRSRIDVPEDDFGLAEIASGFNKRTLISPLHAVLMAAAVANNGTIMEPWVVKSIRDKSGMTLYRAASSRLASPIKEETAGKMRILMGETVLRGTCRSAFSSLRRKRAFKDVEFGAKTGTINDSLNEYKYDWLAAYALPGSGSGGICIAVLAVHGEKLGIRAKDIGRFIINKHFSSKERT
jgi:peptidoglycan glycosyltransferase